MRAANLAVAYQRRRGRGASHVEGDEVCRFNSRAETGRANCPGGTAGA